MSFADSSPAFSSSVSNLSASSSSAIHPSARSSNRSPRMSATPGSSAGALASASGATRSFDKEHGSFGSQAQRRLSEDPAFNADPIPGADSAEKVPRTARSVAPIDGGILGAIRAGSDIAPRDDAAAETLPKGSKNIQPLSPQGDVGSGGVLDESGRRVGLFSPSGSSAPRPVFKQTQEQPSASLGSGRAGGRAWSVTDTRTAVRERKSLSTTNGNINISESDIAAAIVPATSVDSADDDEVVSSGAPASRRRAVAADAPRGGGGMIMATQRDIDNAIITVESEGEDEEMKGVSPKKEGEARRARAVQRRDKKLEELRLRAEDSMMGEDGAEGGGKRVAAPCTSVSSTRPGAGDRAQPVSESGSGRRSSKTTMIEITQRDIDNAITPAVSEESKRSEPGNDNGSGVDSLLSPVVVQTGARTPASSSSLSEAGNVHHRDSSANGRTELEAAVDRSISGKREGGAPGMAGGGLTPLMEESRMAVAQQRKQQQQRSGGDEDGEPLQGTGSASRRGEGSLFTSRASVLNYNNEGVVVEEDPGAWAADAAAGGRAGVASPQWALEDVEPDANELEATSSAGISSKANTSMSTSMHSVSLPTSAGVAEVSTAETHEGRTQKACEAGVCEVVDRLTLASKAKRKLFGTKTSKKASSAGPSSTAKGASGSGGDAAGGMTSPVEVSADAPPAPTGVVSPTGIPFFSFKRSTASSTKMSTAEEAQGGASVSAEQPTRASAGGATMFSSGDSGTATPDDSVKKSATATDEKGLKQRLADQVTKVSGLASKILPQKAQQEAACVIDDTSEAIFGNSAGVEGSVEEKARYAATRNECPARQASGGKATTLPHTPIAEGGERDECGFASGSPQGVGRVAGDVRANADAVRSEVAKGLSETAAAVQSRMKGTADEVKTRVEGVRETVEHLAEDAKERLQAAAEMIKSKLSSKGGGGGGGGAKGGEEVEGGVEARSGDGSEEDEGPSASARERISRTATTTATAMVHAAEGAVSKVVGTVQQKQQQLQSEGVGATIKDTVSDIKTSVQKGTTSGGATVSHPPPSGLEAGVDAGSGEKVVVYGLGAEPSTASQRSAASPTMRPAVPSSTTA